MDKKFTIGSIIWQEAENQGFKKYIFAEKMDVSRQTLDNWIKGASEMNFLDVQKASKILNKRFDITQEPATQAPDETDYKELLIATQKEIIELMKRNRELEIELARFRQGGGTAPGKTA